MPKVARDCSRAPVRKIDLLRRDLIVDEDLDDSFSGVAVPKLRRRCGRPHAPQDTSKFVHDFSRIRANQYIRPVRQSHRPLGILAQSDAGHPENRGLLLNAPRIGQDNFSARHKMEKIEITQGRHESNSHARIPWFGALHKVIDEIIAQICLLDLF